MSSDTGSKWRRILPRSIRRFPPDLVAVVVLSGLMIVTTTAPVIKESIFRMLLASLFVLFIPGYTFVAALFPAARETIDEAKHPDRRDSETGAVSRDKGINGMERVALSFGTSIAIVTVIGLILNVTPWGLQLTPVLFPVCALTGVFAYVGDRRRAKLESADRFQVPYKRWVAKTRRVLLEPDTQRDAVLNVVVVLSVLLAAGSVGYAVTVPKQADAFTEFYLVTENGDGELIADDYPTEFQRGESKSLVVGIGNYEHETSDYTVVSEIQRVRIENNSTEVLESESLNRFSPTVDDGETWNRTHEVAPTMTGERLRLTYLLYRGSAPAEPTTENAYRELNLWVNVTTDT